MIEFLSPVLGFLALAAMFWYNHISYSKWYNHPDTVAEREKEYYERAHAYLKGKCCCGRD